MHKPVEEHGTLTILQGMQLWWACVWRVILWSLAPYVIVRMLLVAPLGPANAAMLANLLTIVPIYLLVLPRVINKLWFRSFEIRVTQKNQARAEGGLPS
jgi:hypothetical protein